MGRSSVFILISMGIMFILCPLDTEARMSVAQMKAAAKGMARSCVTKSGVSQEVLAETRNGVFLPDKALQCYFLCLMKQMKAINNGELALDVMNKQIDLIMPLDLIEKMKEVTQLCYDKATSADSCERSWQFLKCFYETDPALYFFP